MRRALATTLQDAAWPSERIADAQVVLAELATNAFLHDAAALFSVVVVRAKRRIELRTAHAGTTLPPPAPVTVCPTRTTPGGRGLAIVDQLVAERRVASVGGVTSTVVIMAY